MMFVLFSLLLPLLCYGDPMISVEGDQACIALDQEDIQALQDEFEQVTVRDNVVHSENKVPQGDPQRTGRVAQRPSQAPPTSPVEGTYPPTLVDEKVLGRDPAVIVKPRATPVILPVKMPEEDSVDDTEVKEELGADIALSCDSFQPAKFTVPKTPRRRTLSRATVVPKREVVLDVRDLDVWGDLCVQEKKLLESLQHDHNLSHKNVSKLAKLKVKKSHELERLRSLGWDVDALPDVTEEIEAPDQRVNFGEQKAAIHEQLCRYGSTMTPESLKRMSKSLKDIHAQEALELMNQRDKKGARPAKKRPVVMPQDSQVEEADEEKSCSTPAGNTKEEHIVEEAYEFSRRRVQEPESDDIIMQMKAMRSGGDFWEADEGRSYGGRLVDPTAINRKWKARI